MSLFLTLVAALALAIPALWSLTKRIKAEAARLKRPIAGWQVWAVNLVLAEGAALAYTYLLRQDGAAYPIGTVLLAGAFIGLSASGLIDGLELIGGASVQRE